MQRPKKARLRLTGSGLSEERRVKSEKKMKENGAITSAQVIFPDRKTLDEVINELKKEIAAIKTAQINTTEGGEEIENV